MNLIFMPMFVIGLMGVNRRLWDAGASYAHAQPTLPWQTHMTYAAFLLAAFQLPFLWNLTRNWSRRIDSLSWGQVAKISEIRSDTGTSGARLGLWLFLASETMFFASLLSGYVMLRAGAAEWPDRPAGFPLVETLLLIGASAAFGPSRFRLIAANSLGLTFVAIKILADLELIRRGLLPATNLALACWYTLTWVHAAHVLGGALFTGWLAGPASGMAEGDRDRWAARIEATRRYWLYMSLVWLLLVTGFTII